MNEDAMARRFQGGRGSALLLSAALVLHPGSGLAQPSEAPREVVTTGTLYDLDFSEGAGWTQGIVRSPDGNTSVVFVTSNAAAVGLMAVAATTGFVVEITHTDSGDPKRASRIVLHSEQVPAGEGDRVVRIDLDLTSGRCTALVAREGGKKITVWTNEAAAQHILETSLQSGIPIQYLTTDSSDGDRIVRVKLGLG